MILGAVATAAVIVGASSRGDTNHYALDPLRDCLALRGSLVTFVPGGPGSEGTALVDVRGDTARLAFAHDGKEARAIAAAGRAAQRHGNLVVQAAASAPGSRVGEQTRATIERCLSAAHGRPKLVATGYAYPESVLRDFQSACRDAATTQAQCRCVLTQAQAVAPPDVFQRLAVTTVSGEEELMTQLLDSCLLVG